MVLPSEAGMPTAILNALSYALQPGGNFVAYYYGYATHSSGGSIDDKYCMVIDDDYVLHIHIKKEIWSNVRYTPL